MEQLPAEDVPEDDLPDSEKGRHPNDKAIFYTAENDGIVFEQQDSSRDGWKQRSKCGRAQSKRTTDFGRSRSGPRIVSVDELDYSRLRQFNRLSLYNFIQTRPAATYTNYRSGNSSDPLNSLSSAVSKSSSHHPLPLPTPCAQPSYL